MFSPSRKEWERTMIISFISILLCCCKCKYLYTALAVCYEDLLTLTMRHPSWIFLFFGGRIVTFAPV